MPIIKKEVFQTPDGKMFDNRIDAVVHIQKEEFRLWYEGLTHEEELCAAGGVSVYSIDLMIWLSLNRDRVLNLLDFERYEFSHENELEVVKEKTVRD